MKKIAFLFSTLFLSVSLAQTTIAPKAIELLEKAKTAQGGTALENMKTWQSKSTVTIYQNGEVAAAFNYVQLVDFTGERLRFEYLAEDKIAQIVQVTPTEAWTWSEESGTIKQPAAQAKLARDSLYQGIFALRLGAKNFDSATTNGVVTLGDGLQGDSITVTTKGVTSNFIVDKDGTFLGGKIEDVTSVNSDFRVIDGVKFAFLNKVFSKAQLLFETKTSDLQINPAFTDATFAKPK
jgi:hypothetical protein